MVLAITMMSTAGEQLFSVKKHLGAREHQVDNP
jgi:hypothetical protein